MRRPIFVWVVDPVRLPTARADAAHPRTLCAGEDVDVFGGFAIVAHAQDIRASSCPARLASWLEATPRRVGREIASRRINPRRGMGQPESASLRCGCGTAASHLRDSRTRSRLVPAGDEPRCPALPSLQSSPVERTPLLEGSACRQRCRSSTRCLRRFSSTSTIRFALSPLAVTLAWTPPPGYQRLSRAPSVRAMNSE